MSNLLEETFRLVLKLHIKIVYILGQTYFFPFFLFVNSLSFYLCDTYPVAYQISFYIILYYTVGTFMLTIYYKNPSNVKLMENFVGKEFLHRYTTHSGLNNKGAQAAAAALAAAGGYKGFQYLETEQAYRHLKGRDESLADVEKSAMNNGDSKGAEYANRARTALLSQREEIRDSHSVGPSGISATKERIPVSTEAPSGTTSGQKK